MHRTAFTLALLACATAAHATEPTVKTVTQGYAGACQGASLADESRIRRGPLFGTATAPARVTCSPAIDTSENGAYAFGLTVGNAGPGHVTVTCTAEISTVGAGPQGLHTRSVIVSPQARGKLTWGAADTGEGRTFRGGQVGVTCTLPAGVSLSNIWTRSVAN